MSDPKDFLARWSQRKLSPEAPKPEPEQNPTALPASNKDVPAAPEPEFDIASLPSLESIGANSDIRAFLQRGVPATLTRAALRRAWSSDPAIRDFVGLSENSWDFNAPDSVPGFASILPSDQAQRMIADMFGDNEPATPSMASSEALEKCDVSAPPESAQAIGTNTPPPGPASDVAAADQNVSNVAPREEDPADDSAKTIAQRHGGALPR